MRGISSALSRLSLTPPVSVLWAAAAVFITTLRPLAKARASSQLAMMPSAGMAIPAALSIALASASLRVTRSVALAPFHGGENLTLIRPAGGTGDSKGFQCRSNPAWGRSFLPSDGWRHLRACIRATSPAQQPCRQWHPAQQSMLTSPCPNPRHGPAPPRIIDNQPMDRNIGFHCGGKCRAGRIPPAPVKGMIIKRVCHGDKWITGGFDPRVSAVLSGGMVIPC